MTTAPTGSSEVAQTTDPGSALDVRVKEAQSATRLASRSLLADISIVAVVALALGLVHLSRPSLWVDESFTAQAMGDSYLSLMTDQYHWLYYTLMKPWTAVAGTSEWSLRLPSVFGTVLACALLVVLGRRVSDRRVALASGLLLAASPFVVKWSQQARGYTFLMALGVLATLLLLWAIDRDTRGAWALYGLALAVLIVWHPVGGFLVVPSHLVLAYQHRGRLLPHGLLAAVIVCALALPWAGQIFLRSTGEKASINWLDAPSPATAVHALLDVSGASGLGLVLAAAGLVFLWRLRSRGAFAWLATWACAPFAVSLVVSIAKPIFLDRYLLVAAPAFALLAGFAVVQVGQRVRPVVLAALVAACVVGLVHWYGLGTHGNWRGEDWRDAARAAGQVRTDSEPLVVADWSASPAARYYGATVVDVSSAPSIWVLRWSDEGIALTKAERVGLGFGDHHLVGIRTFGSRLDLEHWVR
jgi:mannosyltransferase